MAKEAITEAQTVRHLQNQPFIADFLSVIQQTEYVDFQAIYRLRKYLENPELSQTLQPAERKAVAYLHNNLRLLRRLLTNRNGLRVFLSLKYPDNAYSLARRLKTSRATARHWAKKLLELQIIKVNTDWAGNEIMLVRNPDKSQLIELLDIVAQDQLQQIALQQTRRA